MVLYQVLESSIEVGEKFGHTPYNQGIVVATDWHDSLHDERVILVARGHRHYSVRIVKEAPTSTDGTTWDVLYDETFPTIELAVTGQMEPQPPVYHWGPHKDDIRDAGPWQPGYLDCKER